jgi:hypothetical protein
LSFYLRTHAAQASLEADPIGQVRFENKNISFYFEKRSSLLVASSGIVGLAHGMK